MTDPLLSLEDVHAAYGESTILRGVSMAIEEGEVVSLLGRNGVGKTTTLRTIVGELPPQRGRIVFDGEDISGEPIHAAVNRGIGYVPEDRQVFPDLSVEENLRMGAIGPGEGVFSMEEVFEQFPVLGERRTQTASYLSGGEQQMLVIARALLRETRLLLLDEPTEGLAPQIVQDVIGIIREISDTGLTILLVEQNLNAAMKVADRHHILGNGTIVFEGTTGELEAAEDVKDTHVGVGAATDSF